jgi:hypothetical protein
MQRICDMCQARADDANMKIIHETDCPNHPDAVDDTPIEQWPTNVTDFALARADKGSKPREHRPADALDLARAWMEKCGPDNQPDHIIIFLGRTHSDNSSGTKYFQTGNFGCHAQVGLVWEGLELLRSTGRE